MSIEFSLGSKETRFGLVSDPKTLVIVRTREGNRAYRFLVDTGADFSVAPRRLAEEVVLDWAALPVARVVGIEQGGVEARLGPLSIEIGGIALTVRCLFVDSPRGPFLLGRADFLDRFALTVDQRRRRIILEDRV